MNEFNNRDTVVNQCNSCGYPPEFRPWPVAARNLFKLLADHIKFVHTVHWTLYDITRDIVWNFFRRPDIICSCEVHGTFMLFGLTHEYCFVRTFECYICDDFIWQSCSHVNLHMFRTVLYNFAWHYRCARVWRSMCCIYYVLCVVGITVPVLL